MLICGTSEVNKLRMDGRKLEEERSDERFLRAPATFVDLTPVPLMEAFCIAIPVGHFEENI